MNGMEGIVDMVLLGMLAATGIAISRQQSLLAAVMLAGIFSLLGAGWMLFLDAPDVAFTEAAVGAGISTILFLATLSVVPAEAKPSRRSYEALAAVVLTGGALVYGTLDMPRFGDPDSPANRSPVTRAYLSSAAQPHAGHQDASDGHSQGDVPPTDGLDDYAVGIPNTVTTVLASFRGYDTMGETAVVFTAGFGVVIILGGARRRRFHSDDSQEEESS